MASGRARTRSTLNQTSVKYRSIFIFDTRNINIHSGDLKILHKKCPNRVDFRDVILNLSKIVCGLH